MDRCAHEDKRCVQSILVAALWVLKQVDVACSDDLVLDAFVLAIVVDAHVTDRAKAQLSNLWEHISEFLFSLLVTDQLCELGDCISAEQGSDTSIAKGDVDKRLEQMDEVLSLFVSHFFRIRVLDKRHDHELRNTSLNESLASILVHS